MNRQNNNKITYVSEGSEEPQKKTKKLSKKLKECQKEKEEYLSQVQRARADFINFRQRQDKIIEDIRKYSKGELIKDLLPVLDSLQEAGKDNEGINQIKKQLEKILESYGVQEIKTLKEKFDPKFHEAIEKVDSQETEGTIIEELQKGYTIGEKILRISKVKIAK